MQIRIFWNVNAFWRYHKENQSKLQRIPLFAIKNACLKGTVHKISDYAMYQEIHYAKINIEVLDTACNPHIWADK